MNKPLSYYLDNFATIAKDQGASRYLQDLLNNYSETEINYFFQPLCKNILQIIDDTVKSVYINSSEEVIFSRIKYYIKCEKYFLIYNEIIKQLLSFL